jgi:pimeloyl-ACP methyl ester carboxylesterase
MSPILRLRLAPVVACAVLGSSLYFAGFSGRACAAIAALGVVASVAGYILQPIPVLAPSGGSHHVGIRHIGGHRTTGMPTVAVFYPTSCPPLASEPWLPHSDLRYAHGMAAHANVPSFLLSNQQALVRMKATRNASLLSLRLPTGGLRTIVVLCHGLAAHHQAYVCAAMDLAARGAIVFCPQHGDGSAAFCRDGEDPDMDFVRMRQVQRNENEVHVREQQLQIRVKEALRLVGAIENGSLFDRMFCSTDDLKDFASRDSVRVVIAGHSFGAATALATAVRLLEMRNSPSSGASSPSSVSDRVHISHVICNDLWHMPLAPLCSLLRSNERLISQMPPLLLQESVQWEKWSENKAFEAQLMQTLASAPSGGPLVQRMVMENTDHLSFSDIGVLSPIISRKKYARGSSRKKITAFVSQMLNFISK